MRLRDCSSLETRNLSRSWNENLDKPMGNLWNPYWNGWAPRVGLAWDVHG